MIAEHIGARSDRGPFRSSNQDAYWVSDASDPLILGELYIVTDGVGGQEFGAAAAQLAAQVISSAFYQKRQAAQPVSQALSQAIYQANEAIYEQAQERGGVKMGCTVVAAVQHDGLLHVAHVGDARVYLLQKNKLRQLTRDDSWVQKQIDAGIITPEEAENHELRNVVTQALGNKLDIEVHQSKHENYRSGDRLLLCTDGLHGVLSDAEIIKLLKNNPPQTAADALVQAAIDAGTQDNVTAVVVALEKSNGLAAAPGSAGQKRTIPVWALVTLVTLALLAVAWGIYTFWPASNSPGGAAPIPTLAPTALMPAADQPTAVPVINTAVPPTAPPATATSLPPTETPAPLPTDTAVPQSLTAVVQSEAGINLRPAPNTDNEPLGILQNGTVLEILPGRETDADQLVWQEVRVPDSGQEGWVAAIYLKYDE